MSAFEILNKVNVNEHTEKKNGLTYLSWAFAWQEVKKAFPDATYTVYENADGWNYFTDGRTAWVKTGVTINGLEHIEDLPVMDFKNKSIPLESITSVDVNKTIQRSLTKAAARHGLGLYIYAGEDLPEEEKKEKKQEDTDLTYHGEGMTQERLYKLEREMERTKVKEAQILKTVGVEKLENMTEAQYIAVMNKLARTADARQTA